MPMQHCVCVFPRWNFQVLILFISLFCESCILSFVILLDFWKWLERTRNQLIYIFAIFNNSHAIQYYNTLHCQESFDHHIIHNLILKRHKN